MRRLWEKLCAFLLGMILGIVFLTFAYTPSRQWPADILVRHDKDIKSADAIVMLMGNVLDRSNHCAKLIKKGVAPVIVFVEAEKDDLSELGYRLGDGDASFRYLKRLGLKDESIIFDSAQRVTSTAEEIEADFKLIKKRLPQAKRIVLCTSWYHSSRSLWIAEKFNTFEYELKSIPSTQPKSWYAKEFDFLMVFNEYLKWAYYLMHY